MEVPFGLPSLDKGAHKPGTGKACIMEYVSVLAGEKFSDSPACTHPVLAHLSRRVFDLMDSDEMRFRMVPQIGRLFGTAPAGGAEERKALAVAMAQAGVDLALRSAQDPERDSQTPSERLLELFVTVLDAYDEFTGRTESYTLTEEDLRKFEDAGLLVSR